jgi:stress-induced morphogen
MGPAQTNFIAQHGVVPMIEPSEIQNRIEKALPDARVVVSDLTGGRDHYQVEVVSTVFAGMSKLQRHRKIYDLFSDVMGGALHALSLKTTTPDGD